VTDVDLSRRVVAETVGTALLVTAVVGSGIMGERLAGGNIALALLANAVATGAALVCLIQLVGGLLGVAGAHAMVGEPCRLCCPPQPNAS
jgi:glycerol uptake facilitator-like aquaporin